MSSTLQYVIVSITMFFSDFQTTRNVFYSHSYSVNMQDPSYCSIFPATELHDVFIRECTSTLYLGGSPLSH